MLNTPLSFDDSQIVQLGHFLGSSWHSLFFKNPLPIAVVGHNKQFLIVNQAFCDFTEYSANELLTKTFEDITHPADIHVDSLLFNQLISGQISHYILKKRYITRTGKTVWLSLEVQKCKHKDIDDYVLLSFVTPLGNDVSNELRKMIYERSKKYEDKSKFRWIIFIIENWKSIVSIGTLLIGALFSSYKVLNEIESIKEKQNRLDIQQQQLLEENNAKI